MSTITHLVRAGGVVAGGTALALLAAGPASAHHCYKEWNDAARAQVSTGTSWMAMSDFVSFAATEFFGLSDACASHGDEWTQAWMVEAGVTTEPTVHMRATVGGGAAHRTGKEPKPFGYLGDDDFAFLESQIFSEPDCVPSAG
jgi:hypothetical protein